MKPQPGGMGFPVRELRRDILQRRQAAPPVAVFEEWAPRTSIPGAASLCEGAWANPARSHIQETIAIFGGRQHAGFEATEDAVAIAGDYAVSPIAEEAGLELRHETQEAPEAPELLEDEDCGVGTSQQVFIGLIGVDDDINGVEISGVRPAPRKDARGQGTLQRSEAENSCGIAAQDELVQAVAESADAVVKQDGVGHGFAAMDDSSIW